MCHALSFAIRFVDFRFKICANANSSTRSASRVRSTADELADGHRQGRETHCREHEAGARGKLNSDWPSSRAKSGGHGAPGRFGSMLGGKRRGAFHPVPPYHEAEGRLTVDPAGVRALGRSPAGSRADRRKGVSRPIRPAKQLWALAIRLQHAKRRKGAFRFFMKTGRGALGRSPAFLCAVSKCLLRPEDASAKGAVTRRTTPEDTIAYMATTDRPATTTRPVWPRLARVMTASVKVI
jgi:hypothetical protein